MRFGRYGVTHFYPYLGRSEIGQPFVIIGVDKTEEAMEVLKDNRVISLTEKCILCRKSLLYIAHSLVML